MPKRSLTSHVCPGLNEHVNVIVMDAPGSGGASHHYRIEPIVESHPQGAINSFDVRFQNGPISEGNDVNGCSNESLIAIVIDRLQGFQRGEFSCRENALALTKLEEAMHWLQHRTHDRVRRGVEGTLAK